MSPVESMSAWKPVIWVNEWWLKESIIHNKTWLLIDEKCSVDDIVKAVNFIDSNKALEMRIDCEQRARYFSIDSFREQLLSYLK